MKIWDAHFHSEPEAIDASALLRNMKDAGISGGAIFSPEPASPLEYGYSYETRMNSLCVSPVLQELYFGENMMRFLNLREKTFTHQIPEEDGSNS